MNTGRRTYLRRICWLMLCVMLAALLAIWWRSYSEVMVRRAGWGGVATVEMGWWNGELFWLWRVRPPAVLPSRPYWMRYSSEGWEGWQFGSNPDMFLREPDRDALVFRQWRVVSVEGLQTRQIVVPMWPIALLLGLMAVGPAGWFVARTVRGHLRLRADRCVDCGADLRGSGQACARCGRRRDDPSHPPVGWMLIATASIACFVAAGMFFNHRPIGSHVARDAVVGEWVAVDPLQFRPQRMTLQSPGDTGVSYADECVFDGDLVYWRTDLDRVFLPEMWLMTPDRLVIDTTNPFYINQPLVYVRPPAAQAP